MRDGGAPESREVGVDTVLRRVMALAEAQHSVVTLDDMQQCGADKSWVYRQVRVGSIDRLGPSTYGVAGVRRSFADRAMAVVASVRGPVLVSHRSAAHLHGFERVLEPLSVEITVPRHHRPRPRPGIKVHESLAFDLAEPTACDGIPVTGVARMILDCAPAEAKPIRLLDDALRRRVVTWEQLWSCYLTHNVRGRNVAPFRRILLERDGNTPPAGEFAPRMAAMLTAGGLPMPVFEHRVVVGGHEYYLDLAWPARMVAVECNDAGSHDTPKAFRRDPMKRNRCEGAGWLYLEFTWWDMVHESVEVLAQVAAALTRNLRS
jgi:predicted transcriptional regulator of viral defense system